MASQDRPQPDHGPYPPRIQALGGSPNPYTDTPICAVFLTLFVIAAALHMGLFKWNQKRRQKFFPMNAATFGFCITRMVANTMRIVWAYFPRNIRIAMVAQIFVYAGIPILFVGNILFAMRIIRGQHPSFGWAKPFTAFIFALVFITVATVVTVIPAAIYGFFTLSEHTAQQIRDIQLFALTTFAVIAFLPTPFVVISSIIARRRLAAESESFGKGSMASKVFTVIVGSMVLSLGAAWRAGTLYLPPTPLTAPERWYFGKWAFYIFNFTFEAFVVYFWLLVRIDEKFYVPDKSRGTYQADRNGVYDVERDHGSGRGAAAAVGFEKRHSSRKARAIRMSEMNRGADSQQTLVRRGSDVNCGGHSRVSIPDSLHAGDPTGGGVDDDAPEVPLLPRDMMDERAIAGPYDDVDVVYVRRQGWERRSGR